MTAHRKSAEPAIDFVRLRRDAYALTHRYRTSTRQHRNERLPIGYIAEPRIEAASQQSRVADRNVDHVLRRFSSRSEDVGGPGPYLPDRSMRREESNIRILVSWLFRGAIIPRFVRGELAQRSDERDR